MVLYKTNFIMINFFSSIVFVLVVFCCRLSVSFVRVFVAHLETKTFFYAMAWSYSEFVVVKLNPRLQM